MGNDIDLNPFATHTTDSSNIMMSIHGMQGLLSNQKSGETIESQRPFNIKKIMPSTRTFNSPPGSLAGKI